MRRFLIVSDIHACDVDPSTSDAPSYVSNFSGVRRSNLDPLTELDRLIDGEGLSPDCILCPGDITNRANPVSFSYAWDRLNRLSARLAIPLVTTVGNHDVDSRYKTNSYDPLEFAKNLSPPIPTPERPKYLEYWAENFTLISRNDCNILVLNTTAYHGAGRDVGSEIEHGRISDVTLSSIRQSLLHVPKAEVNILLCHHHPLKAEPSDTELEGLTRGGDKLIELLNERAEAWIVVHGHKHIPDLFYGHGGSNSPVILSCASFSAQVNVDAKNKNPNQFHLLACDPTGAKAAGWTSAGTVASWTWQPGIGWRKAHGIHGLKHLVGFGYRASAAALAAQVDGYLLTRSINQASWHDAVSAIPSLQCIVPTDFAAFERVLEEKGLGILADRDGSFAQVGRLA